MDKKKYAILILAAGSSKRLGLPKQTVKWKQTTLLNHTIEQALKVDNTDVIVALGGNQIDVLPTITHQVPMLTIMNWRDGMGTSISDSLEQMALQKYKAVIIAVCDQPYISDVIFNDLITTFEASNATIVLSKYTQSSGPPTLFHEKYFFDLLELKGDFGAKEVVKTHHKEVATTLFPNGDFDIDTEENLKQLLQSDEHLEDSN